MKAKILATIIGCFIVGLIITVYISGKKEDNSDSLHYTTSNRGIQLINKKENELWQSLKDSSLTLTDSTSILNDIRSLHSVEPAFFASNKASTNSEPSLDKSFICKLVFSVIFLVAALYVILSKKEKYDDTTRQWAFSVLTLIAGIWVGTAV